MPIDENFSNDNLSADDLKKIKEQLDNFKSSGLKANFAGIPTMFSVNDPGLGPDDAKQASPLTRKAAEWSMFWTMPPMVGRTPLLYTDIMLDPLLLFFPKDRLNEVNKRFRRIAETDATVSNIIDVHSKFPISDFKLECDDPEVEEYYNDFADRVNLLQICQGMLYDFHVCGESFTYGNWDVNNFEWSEFVQFPPENIDVYGTYISTFKIYVLKPDPELQRRLKAAKGIEKELSKHVETAYLKTAMEGKPYVLDNRRLIAFIRNPVLYGLRGVSPLWAILHEVLLQLKYKMLQLTFCFAPGTEVVMADGKLKPIESVKIGELVRTHKGRIRKIIDTMSREYKGKMLKIYPFNESKPLVCTPEHPFIVYSKDPKNFYGTEPYFVHGHDLVKESEELPEGFIIKKAEDIKLEDYLCIPAGNEEGKKNPLTKDQARLIGYFLAEGCHRPYHRNKGADAGLVFSFSAEGKNTWVKDVKNILKNEFNRDTINSKGQKKSTFVFQTKGIDYEISSWMKQYVKGKGSLEKYLSEEIFEYSPEILEQILIGFLRGDGTSKDYRFNILACTSSLKLGEQISSLLNICNIAHSTRISTRPPCHGVKKERIARYFSIPGLLNQDFVVKCFPKKKKKFSERKKKERKLIDRIKKLREKGFEWNEIANEFNKKGIYTWKHNRPWTATNLIQRFGSFKSGYRFTLKKKIHGFILVPIKKIEVFDYEGKVFNITVDEDHSFLARYFANKQCDRHLFPLKIFKLGNEHWIPSKRHFQDFINQLSAAANDPDYNIVTHFAVNVDYVTTKDKIENLIPHFEFLQRRIMIGLFCPEALLTSEASPYASAAVSMRVLMNRYLTIRDLLEKALIYKIFLPLASARGFIRRSSAELNHKIRIDNKRFVDGRVVNGFPRVANWVTSSEVIKKKYYIPRFIWEKLNLMDNTTIQRFFMELRDKRELPFSVICEIFGLDERLIKEKLKQEYNTPFDPAWRLLREEFVRTEKEAREAILKGETLDKVIEKVEKLKELRRKEEELKKVIPIVPEIPLKTTPRSPKVPKTPEEKKEELLAKEKGLRTELPKEPSLTPRKPLGLEK